MLKRPRGTHWSCPGYGSINNCITSFLQHHLASEVPYAKMKSLLEGHKTITTWIQEQTRPWIKESHREIVMWSKAPTLTLLHVKGWEMLKLTPRGKGRSQKCRSYAEPGRVSCGPASQRPGGGRGSLGSARPALHCTCASLWWHLWDRQTLRQTLQECLEQQMGWHTGKHVHTLGINTQQQKKSKVWNQSSLMSHTYLKRTVWAEAETSWSICETCSQCCAGTWTWRFGAIWEMKQEVKFDWCCSSGKFIPFKPTPCWLMVQIITKTYNG